MSESPHFDAGDETADSLILIRLAQAGEDSALERLFERYYPQLREMVKGMVGEDLRRRVESGDVLQDALCKAILHFDRFDIPSRAAFFALMRTMIVNQLRDDVRRHGAQKRDRRVEVALQGIGAAPDPSPSSIAARKEEVELVERCVARLPERDRRLVALVREGGLSWSEIAQEAALPSEDAARMAYGRAETKLGRMLRKALGGGE